MSKRIFARNGEMIIVDDEDFEYLRQWRWYINAQGYAVGYKDWNKEKKSLVRMHRIINRTPSGLLTDHINGNKLDNRRNNLRNANRSQNACNSRPRSNSTNHKGVSWDGKNKRWRVQIGLNGKNYVFGRYEEITDAIKVANKKRLELHGEFARIQ